MFYYRYRPFSELAIKELIYDEIFFASSDECNDPYDSKEFLKFDKDIDKWKRLIKLAWKNIRYENIDVIIEDLAKHMTILSPITFDDAIKLDYEFIISSFSHPIDSILTSILDKELKEFMNLYGPEEKYFASFSNKPNNSLMWSHYASMHYGFCLIFKPLDNKLYQDTSRKKTSIRRKSSKGFFKNMSFQIPESFEFCNVNYDSITSIHDAFKNFPVSVFGRDFNDEERNEYNLFKTQQILTKNICWDYEQEVRLFLTPLSSWLIGEKTKYTQYERLFNFNSTQLTGIILGARMEQNNKNRIKEIIYSKLQNLEEVTARRDPLEKITRFGFVIFEAELSTKSRDVDIKPKEIYSYPEKYINNSDENFEQILEKWYDGYGIEYMGNESKIVKVGYVPVSCGIT